MMNSSKGPQISSSLPAETKEPQKNEPLLPFIEKEELERSDILKNVEDSFSELGISFNDRVRWSRSGSISLQPCTFFLYA